MKLALLALVLTGCANTFGAGLPPGSREGGLTLMLCIVAVCNFQSTTGQVKGERTSQTQTSDAEQEGKLEVKPK